MRPVQWRDSVLVLLDQTKLPRNETYVEIDNYQDVVEAIRRLRVRGAPLIGVAAAYGMALAANSSAANSPESFRDELADVKAVFDAVRPTAVNLTKATDRIVAAVATRRSIKSMKEAAVREAERIFKETEQADLNLSQAGADLIDDGDTIMTICNTGALATGAYGTALGVIRAAYEQGKEINVLACETRPLLQGARLTMWELSRLGIPATLIVDSAAGHFMRRGLVTKVITGADRIAANGDTANKIGTYTLAVLAARHDRPFYIAAPVSTVDLDTPGGEQITVEERSPEEVTTFAGVAVAPAGADARNPAFDVTPASLITAIITDLGVAYPPFDGTLSALSGSGDN